MPADPQRVFYSTKKNVNGVTQCHIFHERHPGTICFTRSTSIAEQICTALNTLFNHRDPYPDLFPKSKSGSQHRKI